MSLDPARFDSVVTSHAIVSAEADRVAASGAVLESRATEPESGTAEEPNAESSEEGGDREGEEATGEDGEVGSGAREGSEGLKAEQAQVTRKVPLQRRKAKVAERRRGEGGDCGAGPASTDAAEGGMSTAADDPLNALGTGDIAMIDTELAEHLRWGAASASRRRRQRRSCRFHSPAGRGRCTGWTWPRRADGSRNRRRNARTFELGVGRLVARLAGPALARPLSAVTAEVPVIGGVFSAYDLATRDWSRTGETIGRFGEGGSIYEQLANSIASVSEIIGIATAVLNVIAGVIGAISIAMWVITVLTVGVATPLAATLSTIAGVIGIVSMVLDGINALVLQRLVTLFRALHTFTSQADPTDVEARAVASVKPQARGAGFIGGVAGGLAGAGLTGAGARRLGVGELPPHVPDVDAPRAGGGDGPRSRQIRRKLGLAIVTR
jgi:hypothetical protein